VERSVVVPSPSEPKPPSLQVSTVPSGISGSVGRVEAQGELLHAGRGDRGQRDRHRGGPVGGRPVADLTGRVPSIAENAGQVGGDRLPGRGRCDRRRRDDGDRQHAAARSSAHGQHRLFPALRQPSAVKYQTAHPVVVDELWQQVLERR
jgi:hypothetical protein